MRKILIGMALLFGAITLPNINSTVVHADIINCQTLTYYNASGLAYGAHSRCMWVDNGTAYPMQQQRIRIKCRLTSNPNSWYTKTGVWANVQQFSSAFCDSGAVMTERWIMKR